MVKGAYMKKKVNLELPKYRLQLHMRLIKRRKPLVVEPILPTTSEVNKKYKKGTFIGRLARYFADHRNIRKIFAANFAILAIATSFIPQASNVQAEGSSDMVIATQTNLITQKGMGYPVDSVKLNQNYGFFHPGIDFGGKTGDPVKAITSGVVAYAGRDYSGYGNLVVLQHRSGLDSYYAHLSKIEVVTGQVVEINTEIGKMGATGRATGTHLHLEIHQNGVSLNPLTILSK
jgi:murein DD-endopeptidase MepM/ murein hydrolase activator NlpD